MHASPSGWLLARPVGFAKGAICDRDGYNSNHKLVLAVKVLIILLKVPKSKKSETIPCTY
jgi:hypothetical protein